VIPEKEKKKSSQSSLLDEGDDEMPDQRNSSDDLSEEEDVIKPAIQGSNVVRDKGESWNESDSMTDHGEEQQLYTQEEPCSVRKI
jgi:hypothetical protein